MNEDVVDVLPLPPALVCLDPLSPVLDISVGRPLGVPDAFAGVLVDGRGEPARRVRRKLTGLSLLSDLTLLVLLLLLETDGRQEDGMVREKTRRSRKRWTHSFARSYLASSNARWSGRILQSVGATQSARSWGRSLRVMANGVKLKGASGLTVFFHNCKREERIEC